MLGAIKNVRDNQYALILGEDGVLYFYQIVNHNVTFVIGDKVEFDIVPMDSISGKLQAINVKRG